MPNFYVIDPSLFNMTGHEYVMNLFIYKEAISHGYEPVILCQKEFIPNPSDNIKIHPVFQYTPYDKHPISWDYDQTVLTNGNREIFSLLSTHLPSESLPKNSVILLHTACITLLVGLARWIKKLHRPDLKIRIVLRWPAFRRMFHRENAEAYCKKACSIYPKLQGDIRFYADNRGLKAYYEKLTGLPFLQTPIGIQFHDIPPIPPPSKQEGLRFVFAGNPREEKGFFLIVNALTKHLERYPKDIFHLHTIHSPKISMDLRARFPNNVCTNNNFLSGRAYFEYLLKGDILLVPYNIESYQYRTSHIFMEALGLGRSAILTKGSWMEEVLQDFSQPLGIVMEEWTADSLIEAMHQIHEQRESLLQNAYDTAEYIRNTHNPSQWVNLMLEESS